MSKNGKCLPKFEVIDIFHRKKSLCRELYILNFCEMVEFLRDFQNKPEQEFYIKTILLTDIPKQLLNSLEGIIFL